MICQLIALPIYRCGNSSPFSEQHSIEGKNKSRKFDSSLTLGIFSSVSPIPLVIGWICGDIQSVENTTVQIGRGMLRDVAMVQLLNATPKKIYESEAEQGLGDGVVLFVG